MPIFRKILHYIIINFRQLCQFFCDFARKIIQGVSPFQILIIFPLPSFYEKQLLQIAHKDTECLEEVNIVQLEELKHFVSAKIFLIKLKRVQRDVFFREQLNKNFTQLQQSNFWHIFQCVHGTSSKNDYYCSRIGFYLRIFPIFLPADSPSRNSNACSGHIPFLFVQLTLLGTSSMATQALSSMAKQGLSSLAHILDWGWEYYGSTILSYCFCRLQYNYRAYFCLETVQLPSKLSSLLPNQLIQFYIYCQIVISCFMTIFQISKTSVMNPLITIVFPQILPPLQANISLGVFQSIVADLLIEQFRSLERGDYHLREYRLLLLEVSELFLEVGVLLFLIDHGELEGAVEGLDQGGGGGGDFLVYVVDFVLHGAELLPEQLDQLVVFLQVLIRLPGQILSQGSNTSTVPKCPVAWVEFWAYLSGESYLLINKIIQLLWAADQYFYALHSFINIIYQAHLGGLVNFRSSRQWAISACCRRITYFCWSRIFSDFFSCALSLEIIFQFFFYDCRRFFTKDLEAESLQLQRLFDLQLFYIDSFMLFTAFRSLLNSLDLFRSFELILCRLQFETTFDFSLLFLLILTILDVFSSDLSFLTILPGLFSRLMFSLFLYLSISCPSIMNLDSSLIFLWVSPPCRLSKRSVVMCCTLSSRECILSCRDSSSLETSSCLESSKMLSLGEKCFWDVMEKTSESARLRVLGENRSERLSEDSRLDRGMRLSGLIIIIILMQRINSQN